MAGDLQDQRPLFGPDGRIPAVQAVTVARESGIAVVRKGWTVRHTMALVVLGPVVFLAYKGALSPGVDGLAMSLLIALMAVVAATTLTTYLPMRGAERASASSCAAMPGLLVVGAGFLLHQATTPLGAALAIVILGVGLWQRLSGTSACG